MNVLNIFNAGTKTDSCRDFCEDNGIDFDYVNKLSCDNVEVEKELWFASSPRRFFPDDIVLEGKDAYSVLKNSALKIPEYQKNLWLNDNFYVFSPFSGKAIAAQLSLPCDSYHVAYVFHDVHEFFLLVGRWHGRRAALFVPDLDVVFVLDAPEKQPEMIDMMWNSVLRVKSSRLYKSYSDKRFATNSQTKPKVKTLLIGLRENLGHYFWQEISGIERIISLGPDDAEYDIVSCSNRWLSVKELLPDLNVRNYFELEKPGEILEYDSPLYDEDRIWIRPVGIRISESLKNKTYDACRLKVDATEIGKSESIVTTCNNYNVLWMNLRAHNKTWLSQSDGLIQLAKCLANKIPNFAVFLDGFGDSATIAQEIKSSLKKSSIPVFNGIDLPFEESLIWAKHVTSYISVVGSGLVFNSWLVSKSGVAHGNIAHLNQRKFWNNVSEGSEEVHFIEEKDIIGSSAMYGEYDFDWKVFIEPLLEIMSPK